MAQADQSVQNATFPTVRADINDNLAALFSANSGNTAPSVTVAFQDWIDTSGANPLWKKRNAANNAWITVATITGSAVAFEGTLPSQTGNAGEYLTTDGTVASWAAITATGQLLRAPQVLTSGVSYTTPANCTSIYVEAVGGGGGGGGNAGSGGGGGGGSGGYCAKNFTVTASTAYTYAIGASGAGGVSSANGTAGGNTTFVVGGTTITANGGAGGLFESSGGAGGTCTNGDLNIAGQGGGGGGLSPPSGAGGNSFFGGGAAGRGGDGNGFAGTAGGGGSGGASGSSNRTGGAGGTGIIRIWEFS
jgi:hypothetical protein